MYQSVALHLLALEPTTPLTPFTVFTVNKKEIYCMLKT